MASVSRSPHRLLLGFLGDGEAVLESGVEYFFKKKGGGGLERDWESTCYKIFVLEQSGTSEYAGFISKRGTWALHASKPLHTCAIMASKAFVECCVGRETRSRKVNGVMYICSSF